MKKILLIIFTFSLYMSQAQAACDFVINIGDNKAKLVQKFTDPFPMFDNIFMLPVPSPKVCPNDNLDQDIAIEYIFIDDNLAAIRMVVFNDEKQKQQGCEKRRTSPPPRSPRRRSTRQR